MDEIKSALDRALERADRFGKLTAEEMRQQNELKYKPIGEAIVQRFFEHGESSILVEQLNKLEEAGREIAFKSALTFLIETIDMENKELSECAIKGIFGLTSVDDLEAFIGEIRNIFGQYSWQKKLLYEENSDEIGKEIQERLEGAGISGSAIAEFNVGNDDAWNGKVQELRTEFEVRLSDRKRALKQLLKLP